MHEINFVAEIRSGETKAKNLLNQGKIPAVVYGPEVETFSVSLDKVEVPEINRLPKQFCHSILEAKNTTSSLNPFKETK
jgi:large subunit ribosomal protein L25